MAGLGYSLGDFTADRAEEHVVIQARVGARGQITRTDGSPLPTLREGTHLQLRVLAANLTDKAQRKMLSALDVQRLLPAGTELLAIVDARALNDTAAEARLQSAGLLKVLADARSFAQDLRNTPSGTTFLRDKDVPKAHEGLIRVRLLHPQEMERRGLKLFRLRACLCDVPALPRPAGDSPHDYSLNHALTRISELLEVLRISHTGNVFTRYLAPLPGEKALRYTRLGVLRGD